MKEQKRNSLAIWFYFTLIVFGIVFVSVVIMLILVAIFYGKALLKLDTEMSKMIVIPFICSSFLVGSLIAYFVSKKFFRPVDRINEAFKRVSTGDFTTKLPEKSKIFEFGEIYDSFNQMVKELSNIETLRSDFVANVSHEFKTPIANISGYASMLSHCESEEKKKEYIEKINQNSEKLVSLSENILLLSKLENQDFIHEDKPYRLDEQIRKEILSFQGAWEKKNIEWDIDLCKYQVCANEPLVSHIWDNLISNAIKFSAQDGKIDVSLKRTSEGIVFKIRDYGIGMSNATQNHIFEKFYQGDSTRKSEGNGLGLALVKKILDLYRWDVLVDSFPSEGTTITIILNQMGES